MRGRENIPSDHSFILMPNHQRLGHAHLCEKISFFRLFLHLGMNTTLPASFENDTIFDIWKIFK